MDYFKKNNIASQFITDNNFCKTSKGQLIEGCDEIKKDFQKELFSPGGCSSCRKKAIFDKYKNIIIKKLS